MEGSEKEGGKSEKDGWREVKRRDVKMHEGGKEERGKMEGQE